jgi:hypothetical protein
MKKKPTSAVFSLLIAAIQADFDGSAIKAALAQNVLLGLTKPYLFRLAPEDDMYNDVLESSHFAPRWWRIGGALGCWLIWTTAAQHARAGGPDGYYKPGR